MRLQLAYNLPMTQAFLVGGFILTGGHSRRMGRDKALLELEGRPLVLRTADLLRPLVADVVLVGAPERYRHLGLPVLADCLAERGPLAGIVTALAATQLDWNLIVACDLPHLETRFLEFLLQQACAGDTEVDAVVPRTGALWQPLCAAYHRRCREAFEEVLRAGESKITAALDRVRVRAIPSAELERFAFDARIFKNMNTPAELAEARRRPTGATRASKA